MIDRQRLETILSRRFPASTREQVAAAANAIMGLEARGEEAGAPFIDAGFTIRDFKTGAAPSDPPRRKRGRPRGVSPTVGGTA